MGRLSGIGGAFIFSVDPGRLAAWYEEMLGFEFEGSAEFGTFYQVFVGLDPEGTGARLDTTFSIMQAKVPVERPSPSDWDPDQMYGDQPFMVNVRVNDLDGLLDELSDKGVFPLKVDDEGYAKFAWVRDSDGNRIELYEPRIVPGGDVE